MTRCAWWVLVVWSAACDPVTNVNVDNPGVACFDPEVVEDGLLQVEIRDECYSGSARELVMSCTVQLEGARIVVRGNVNYDLPAEVTDDCRSQSASCVLDSVPAGTYTVVYGAGSAEWAPGGTHTEPELCVSSVGGT